MNQPATRTAALIDEHDRFAAGRLPALVRELTEADRERLLAHFLALGHDDRLLRFGQAVPDQVIDHYVRTIDFTQDTIFGVFDEALELVGTCHLAYLPTDGDKRTAEFGVSVVERARGQGIGSKLFERAAMRSRNTQVTTLYMRCLSLNRTMMHIARKAGMHIEYASGNADAYLSLPPADQTSIITEMLQEQAAVFDYAIKRQVQCTVRIVKSILPSDALA